MQASVVYSPAAVKDLEGIGAFLSDCAGPDAAENAIRGILGKVDGLSNLPEIGTPLDSRCIIHSPYRFVLSGKYLAFYRYEEDCVFVDRILDARSDYLRKLFGAPEPGTDLYL